MSSDLPTSKFFFAGQNHTFCRTFWQDTTMPNKYCVLTKLPTIQILPYFYGIEYKPERFFYRIPVIYAHGCFMGWQPGFTHTSSSVRSRLMPILHVDKIYCSVETGELDHMCLPRLIAWFILTNFPYLTSPHARLESKLWDIIEPRRDARTRCRISGESQEIRDGWFVHNNTHNDLSKNKVL